MLLLSVDKVAIIEGKILLNRSRTKWLFSISEIQKQHFFGEGLGNKICSGPKF